MLSVTIKLIMIIDIMLNVIMLSVVAPFVQCRLAECCFHFYSYAEWGDAQRQYTLRHFGVLQCFKRSRAG